ncbi:MAG: hypothetical protein MZW92_53590 [Comamonadaceae bacterium]|nr:hypothetical protein [Comamonadaceae bacterium]
MLRLHGSRLAEDDIETTDGVRVTTPLRTLVDVVVEDRLAADLQVQAFREALQRGPVTARQLAQVKTSRRARQRLDRVHQAGARMTGSSASLARRPAHSETLSKSGLLGSRHARSR